MKSNKKYIVIIISFIIIMSSCHNVDIKNESLPKSSTKYGAYTDYELEFFPSARDISLYSGEYKKENVRSICIIENDYLKSLNLENNIDFLENEFSSIGIKSEKEKLISYTDNKKVQKGDIVIIMLKDVPEIKTNDGFVIEVNDENIVVKAKNRNAVIYALRAIIEQFYKSASIKKCLIEDYPDVGERGLHLDIARKYYSPEWIKKLIKEMSFNRLNTLQLHFSDNEGFRIECEGYPEILSEKYLTKVEVKDIIMEGKKYGVDIIPAIDSPGHMGAILKNYPEYRIKDKDGEAEENDLNINNSDAREMVKNIISEYTILFKDSKYFHLGGDEYIDFNELEDYPELKEFGQSHVESGIIANGLDGYTAYLNIMAEHVKSLGFIPRIWNDGVYRKDIKSNIILDKDIEIGYWSQWDKNIADTETLLEKGHKLFNVSEDLYYVLEEGNDYVFEQFEDIYNDWDAGSFHGGQDYELPDKRIIGAYYAIWSEDEDFQSEDEVLESIYYPLSAMAQKAWAGSRGDDDIDKFKDTLDSFKNLRKNMQSVR